ncbi:MAG: M15 family metallopeptidase [Acidimicrobiia bacterium]
MPRRLVALTLVAAWALTLVPQPPALASDTSTRWEAFSESSGCDSPYTRTPFASKMGSLPNSEAILGPYGTYFGRSISEIRSHLVYWNVPYSGGRRTLVHEAMIPALNEVAANLAAQAAQGRVYNITSVGAFVPRTIGGSYQVSRHGMGLAIDINPQQNPYRSDGKLITNMPQWFVDAWTQEGFCWGGYWQGIKDPMHFSWMGPAATPNTSDSLTPIPPKTSQTGFSGPTRDHRSEFAGAKATYLLGLADGSGNGVPDVIGLRSHPDGAVVDVASSTYDYGYCSVFRWFISDTTIDEADRIVFMDIDGDSGQDLVALKASGATMSATTALRVEQFENLSTSATGASSSSVAFTGADFNGDYISDLWEATVSGTVRIWQGPDLTTLLDEHSLPGGVPSLIAAGDRDGGDTPELFALYPGSSVDVLTFESGWAKVTSASVSAATASIDALAAGDFDGDGRADIETLADGVVTAYLGNSSTGIPADRWFLNPDWDCQETSPVTLSYQGSFYDDEGSIFEANIESIAASGVTQGCNPPFKDAFCPKSVVTRETMAAFLVRALGLTENTHPGFVDVPAGSTFEADIGKLATAGITKGCNPPANDRFCPKDPVSRQTMAAFLVRALELTAIDHPGFRDVPTGSLFATDIAKLATAGITRGCNPPANDRFCPTDPVSRETMAAFLDRAGLGS